jgi:hypothetical protein
LRERNNNIECDETGSQKNVLLKEFSYSGSEGKKEEEREEGIVNVKQSHIYAKIKIMKKGGGRNTKLTTGIKKSRMKNRKIL